jgi:hypothetical protein
MSFSPVFLGRFLPKLGGALCAAFFLRKEAALFEKSAQKLLYAGPWALSATKPMARTNKVFLLLFVHKK